MPRTNDAGSRREMIESMAKAKKEKPVTPKPKSTPKPPPKETVTLKKGDFTTTDSELKERLIHDGGFTVKAKTNVMTEVGKRSQFTFRESAKEIGEFLKKKSKK